MSGFDNSNITDDSLNVVDKVNYYIENGLSQMEAIKLVAKERNMKKNDVYSEYHINGGK